MERTVRAVPEEVIRLHVNGQVVATWTASPVALEALVVGRLLTLGFIRAGSQVRSLRVGRDGAIHVVETEVDAEGAALAAEDAAHRTEHGCGLRFVIDCRPERVVRLPDAVMPPDPDRFPTLFRALFDQSPSRKETGGHHTAALSDGERLLHVHEEIGRHNGVDKVIGASLLAGLDLRRHGLLTTARISGEIMEKAALAGMGWVASRSVPTTLAAEIAAAAGVPTVARAASPDARVFGVAAGAGS
jgi:FdhD protein